MAYITVRQGAPSADYWWDEPFRPHLEVPGPKSVETGLVDLHGNPIHRTQPPIGFGRDNEW